MKKDNENGVLIHVNLSLPYSLRLQAAAHKINISQLTRNALTERLEALEND